MLHVFEVAEYVKTSVHAKSMKRTGVIDYICKYTHRVGYVGYCATTGL